MNDRPRFLSVMSALSLLPGCRDFEVALETFWRACRDLTDDEFEGACEQLLRRARFFPVPSEILAIARPTEDPAFLAGQALRAALALHARTSDLRQRHSGSRILEELGDAAYQAFHACGGAPGLDTVTHDMHGPGIRKRFLECFERVVRLEPQKALPAPQGPDRTPDPVRALTAGVGRLLPSPGGPRRLRA